MQQAQTVYAAFGHGDMPVVMDALADDVEWVIPYPADVPSGGTFHGKSGAQKWLGLALEGGATYRQFRGSLRSAISHEPCLGVRAITFRSQEPVTWNKCATLQRNGANKRVVLETRNAYDSDRAAPPPVGISGNLASLLGRVNVAIREA